MEIQGSDADARYASAGEVLGFLGAKRCRLVCRNLMGARPGSWEERREARRAGNGLIVLEYDGTATGPSVREFASVRAFAPLFSPDGTRLVYNTTFAPSDIFVLSLAAGDIVRVGFGAHPHWWIDPASGDSHVVYRTENGFYNGFPPGRTMRQRLGAGSVPVGEPATICPYGFGGGISRNGRYLATGYAHLIVADLATGEYFQPLGDRQLPDGENQVCDVSMPPDDSPRVMHLRLTLHGQGRHDFFGIARFYETDYLKIWKPEGVSEWQTPEWSTHADFATASGTNVDDKYDLFLVRLSDLAMLRLTWNSGFGHAHLWVDRLD